MCHHYCLGSTPGVATGVPEKASVIKRPVIELDGTVVCVGFDDKKVAALMQALGL